MKDIEKIKSEDLGCQIQYVNPANFAIEQEVAQLVGATVPAPTEPSADDARELGAQLLVFLRRALLPIRSALRTALADIYAHLDSRCTAYTPAAYAPYIPRPYDPMGTPPTPRSVANLLTAITAFSARKISNGSAPNDGIKDGVSLAHLLCGAYASVTEIKDDNPAWGELRGSNYVSTLLGIFPNVTKVTLNCSKSTAAVANNLPALTELNVPYLRDITKATGVTVFSGLGVTEFTIPCVSFTTYFGKLVNSCSSLKKLYLPNLETVRCTNDNNNSMIANCSALEEVYAEKVHSIYIYRSTDNTDNGFVANCVNLKKIVFGDIDSWTYVGIDRENRAPNLIDVEFKSVSCSINLAYWEAANVLSGDNLTTFLQNFKEHIALRLTANGSGKTLTLSQAVRDAIHAAEDTYGIENIIITQKGWRIQPDAS